MDKTGGNHLDRTVKYKIEKAKKNVVTTTLKIKRSRRKEETEQRRLRRNVVGEKPGDCGVLLSQVKTLSMKGRSKMSSPATQES